MKFSIITAEKIRLCIAQASIHNVYQSNGSTCMYTTKTSIRPYISALFKTSNAQKLAGEHKTYYYIPTRY